jgi:hypothetical protein
MPEEVKELKPIELNAAERALLVSWMQQVRAAEEAKGQLQLLVASIAERAGAPGFYSISDDVCCLIPAIQPGAPKE